MYCEIAGPTIGGTHSLFFAANISGVDIIIHSQGWIESGKRFSFIITLPSRTEFHRLGDWLQKKTNKNVEASHEGLTQSIFPASSNSITKQLELKKRKRVQPVDVLHLQHFQLNKTLK